MVKITLFTSKNCPKCPAAKRIVQQVAKELGCELIEIDIHENPITALQYQIASAPSIMIGNEVFSRSEVPTADKLYKAVKRFLSCTRDRI